MAELQKDIGSTFLKRLQAVLGTACALAGTTQTSIPCIV